MEIITQSFLTAYICAELFFLVLRSSDITLALKKKEQRSEKENSKVQNGLVRSLVLEAFLFIPASVSLFLLAIFPLIIDTLLKINPSKIAWYGAIGLIAYGFPFLAVRRIITRIALKTLQEFTNIITQEIKEQGEGRE